MEGTRPVLSEIQALVTKTSFPSPRRTASGFDYNRMYLLLAVLEKRANYAFHDQDVYVNVIGGLQLDEPAADLALVLAAASSFRDKPIDPATAAIGEVGLTGEIRAVTGLQQRLSEASRTGFKTCIIPRHGTGNITAPDGMESVGKGVKVQFNEDGSISIDLHIVVDNVNMNAVGESIIEEVRHQVTECTGTEVREVNVYIDSMMIG